MSVKYHPEKSTEKTVEPALVAEILEAISKDPEVVIAELARATGLTDRVTRHLVRRLRGGHLAVVEKVRGDFNKRVVPKIEDKIESILEYMDDFDIMKADLKDKAVAFGILTEKLQLLRGMPTQILTFEERSHLDGLLPELIKEATRRGMTIDHNAGEFDDRAQESAPRVLPPVDQAPRSPAKSKKLKNAIKRRSDST